MGYFKTVNGLPQTACLIAVENFREGRRFDLSTRLIVISSPNSPSWGVVFVVPSKRIFEGFFQSSSWNMRHYSDANQRALQVLQLPSVRSNDVAYVLDALPQPKNTRRVGVIPPNETFVHSQSAGLTTQHG
jgi:hypothetical protein